MPLNLLAITPLIILALVILIDLVSIAIGRNHVRVASLSFIGLLLAAGAVFLAPASAPQSTPLLNTHGTFFPGLLLIASALLVPMSYSYLARREDHHEEFYVLMLIATVGALVLVWSSHFVSLLLGLEILSVSIYGLAAYTRSRSQSIEAGIKYLVLAAVSASFLLLGMGLIYADQGTMSFAELATSQTHSLLWLTGVGLITVGIGFKLGVVPFHMWIADVYQGAPAPAAAFIATVSKGAVLALLLRFFAPLNIQSQPALFMIFGLIAASSMLIGNLLALLQDRLKRILAYSSIGHFGYLLVAFLATGQVAAVAAAFYLATYIVTTLGAFAVVILRSHAERDADQLEDYRGLFWHQPGLGLTLTIMMLSLAGIPLTGGFIAKFYILNAGVGSALWLLAVVLVLSSVIGLFYYLRVIVTLFEPITAVEEQPARVRLIPSGLTLAVLTVLLVWFGIYPATLINFIHSTAIGPI